MPRDIGIPIEAALLPFEMMRTLPIDGLAMRCGATADGEGAGTALGAEPEMGAAANTPGEGAGKESTGTLPPTTVPFGAVT